MRAGEGALLTANTLLLAFAAVAYLLMPDAAAGHWGTDTGDAGRYLVFLLPMLPDGLLRLPMRLSLVYIMYTLWLMKTT